MSEDISLKEFLTTKIEDLGSKITVSIDGMNDTLKDHNGRLRTNEEWRNRIIGALIVIGVLLSSLLFPAIVSIFKGKSVQADTNLSSEELQQIITELKKQ